MQRRLILGSEREGPVGAGRVLDGVETIVSGFDEGE